MKLVRKETGEEVKHPTFDQLPEKALFSGTINGQRIHLGLKGVSNTFTEIILMDHEKKVYTREYFISPKQVIPDLQRLDITIEFTELPL